VGITFVLADQAGDVEKIAHTLSLHSEFRRSGLPRGSRHPKTPAPGPRGPSRRRRARAGRSR
jgi:hypothetical protein